jgi:hypothetical protein
VIIKDLAVILPDTVLPEGTVVPSFSVWSGNPGQFAFSPLISSSPPFPSFTGELELELMSR